MKLSVGFCAFFALSTPANAVFFTYSQWDQLSDNGRATYMAGAFDTLISVGSGDSDARASQHYMACVFRTKMNNGQLAQNVRAFGVSRPEIQSGTPSHALIQYLIALCGKPPL